MGRIGARLSAFELKLLRQLDAASTAVTLSNLRLASGHNITKPSDDPAGFVALSGLESQLDGVASAMSNVTAASNVVSQAQLAVDKIRTQLDTIRSKALEDADHSLTADERAANQEAIDAAITEINRLSQTDVGGRRVLDGSADFVVTGANSAQVTAVDVIRLANSSGQTIAGSVTAAAERAQLQYTGTGGNTVSATATVTLSGTRGSAEISFTADEALTDARDRINDNSYLTGVTASLSGNVITLSSVDYGSRASVSLQTSSGTFTVTGGDAAGTDYGTDVSATINGLAYTGSGNAVSVSDNGFQYTVDFKSGFSGAFQTITARGAALSFSLSSDVNRQTTLALPGLQPSRLGGLSGRLDQLATGGTAAGLDSNTAVAIRIVDESLAQLTKIEGRVEGFASATIESSSALLTGTDLKLRSAINSIDKVNQTEQSLIVAYNQRLISNALAGLAILDDQRSSVVALISRIAGLA